MKRLPVLLALASLAACAAKGKPAPSAPAESADAGARGSADGYASGDPGGYAYGGSEDDGDYAYEGAAGATPSATAKSESFDDSAPMEEMEASPEAAAAPPAAPSIARDEAVGRSRERRRAERKGARAPLKKSAKADRRRPRPKPVEPEPDFDRNIQAGRLTAGAFDDSLNPEVLTRFAEHMAQNRDTRDVADRVTGEMTVVRIVDASGRPIHDAEVRLDTDQRGARVPTGTDGRAVFFAGWDLPPEHERHGKVMASIQHGRERMSVPVREGTLNTITMRNVQADSVDAVDIALVIDATGSMGDEIDYLKVELRNIARTIERSFPRVDQRFALVVYRDDGDDFVSRSFDFTENLGRFEDFLARQTAGGGGDYPEAMDAALDDTTHLSWSQDSAKVVFLVADAPPHAEQMRRTMDAVDDLRSIGVAFYPVAASGVASEAEIVMRAAAAGSGGQYIFLTDDSGVGNGHAEPHIPCYEVQALRDVMIRMVHTELAGERIAADSDRTIRSVGTNDDGICELRGQ